MVELYVAFSKHIHYFDLDFSVITMAFKWGLKTKLKNFITWII